MLSASFVILDHLFGGLVCDKSVMYQVKHKIHPVITCSPAPGFTLKSVTWFFHGQVLSPSDHYGMATLGNGSATLTVNSATPTDDGRYHCDATVADPNMSCPRRWGRVNSCPVRISRQSCCFPTRWMMGMRLRLSCWSRGVLRRSWAGRGMASRLFPVRIAEKDWIFSRKWSSMNKKKDKNRS